MARATKSVRRARTEDRGASKKGTGKQAAARGRSTERGAVKRGAAKKGVTKRRGSRAALMVKGWTVNFVSGGHSSSRLMPTEVCAYHVVGEAIGHQVST